MANEFKQMLEKLDLEQIEKLRQAKEAIAQMERRRQLLAEQIAAIDEQIAGVANGTLEPAKALGKSAKVPNPALARRRHRGGPSLPDKIVEVLKGQPAGRKVADIAQAVLAAGYQTSAKNFAVIVAMKASRMPQLERVSYGVYRLKPSEPCRP